jgi:predicted MFS family arabinose efflux permease
LMASVGASGAFAVSALSYIPFILVAIWILPRSSSGPSDGALLDRKAAFDAIRQVGGNPTLRGALLTVFVTSVLCSPVLTFCPVLVRDAFAGNVGHFSVAVAAFGLGGLLAASGLLAVDPSRDRRPFASAFALAFAVVVILVALNPWAWALPVLFTLAGLAMTAGNVSANACLQLAAPATLRGRSVSLYMIAMRGGLSIGALVTGVCVHALGIRAALLLNGALAVILHLAIGWTWVYRAAAKAEGDGRRVA